MGPKSVLKFQMKWPPQKILISIKFPGKNFYVYIGFCFKKSRKNENKTDLIHIAKSFHGKKRNKHYRLLKVPLEKSFLTLYLHILSFEIKWTLFILPQKRLFKTQWARKFKTVKAKKLVKSIKSVSQRKIFWIFPI